MSHSAEQKAVPLSEHPNGARGAATVHQTPGIAKSDLEGIVVRWCESRNVGRCPKVAPDGGIKGGEEQGAYMPLATWDCDRVHAALCSLGKGAYFPSVLVRLLDHVYWHGLDASTFKLMEPGKVLPHEVVGLGFRSQRLIEMSLKRFFRALGEAVEEQPRPEAPPEYERG